MNEGQNNKRDIFILCNLSVANKLKRKTYLKQIMMMKMLTMTIHAWLMMKQELPISAPLIKNLFFMVLRLSRKKFYDKPN
uniref:Ovule protein n=1 Tax=Romanomermis culicivorax TaxID=13658 RepID=A0A915JGN7_ROMCU